jgi:hypothetical protein
MSSRGLPTRSARTIRRTPANLRSTPLSRSSICSFVTGPPAEIDRARFDLWLAQLIIDAGRKDASAVNGDFFTLDYIRDRIMNELDAAAIMRLNTQLEDLQGAVGDGHLAEAAKVAARLRNTLAGAAF